jgi:hypothetical protein
MRSRLRFWPTTLVGNEDPVVAHPDTVRGPAISGKRS